MSNSPQQSLYEKDFHIWLEHTATKLKQHRFEEQLPQIWQQALATVQQEYPALELPNWQHKNDIQSFLQESFW
ncbi:hypothetical protein BWI75_06095 [Gloeocapsopsis sp. AAB1 = 1H9]|uniref:DUF29 domain-containing protein n=2 Tax=Gloeocapsopsis TaxID=693222 RepID=A0A6N8FTM6_9CHRO|nr:hypothetical protein [Gloeocapsopsis dulcis AAB1 = 1H9]